MGNKNVIRRAPARRAATFLAVLGALVMSSGVALMVAATPAGAAQGEHVKVGICHATSSDTNPYVFIVVDDDSAKLKGHLMHRDSPNKKWKTDGTYELGGQHTIGSFKRDYIASFVDSMGVSHDLDGNITSESCDEKPDDEILTAVADVDFNDPTCAAPGSGSVDTTGDHAKFTIVPEKDFYAIGDQVVIDAAATDEAVFDEDATTQWKHTFVASDAPCTSVSPPTTTTNPTTVVSPPKTETKTKTESTAVTPTVVSAGLAGASVEDVRGEQGLALMFAGMVMLVAAGGLGLRLRSAASRI